MFAKFSKKNGTCSKRSSAGRLEVVQSARAALHEIPAADPAAHITCCTLYQDSTSWLSKASGVSASTFCVICNESGLIQEPPPPQGLPITVALPGCGITEVNNPDLRVLIVPTLVVRSSWPPP